MKLRTISYTYGRTIPTKQYGNDRLEVTVSAELEEGESPADALAQLRQLGELKALLDADELAVTKPFTAITFVRRDVTKTSGSPLWRCSTSDGRSVNIFKHEDPAKDNFHLFETAGYADALLALDVGDSQNWQGFPIYVSLGMDGRFWNVLTVEKRLERAVPDGATDAVLDKLRSASEDFSKE